MPSVIRAFLGMLLLCSAASAWADLWPSPTTLSFDDQIADTTSDPKAITFNNNGDAALTLSLTAASGAFANAGGSCLPLPVTIPAHANCTILYTFTPPSSGHYDQTLIIGGTFGGTLRLDGKGISGHVTLAPTSLDFIAAAGTTSAMQTMVVSNTGDARMDITSVTPASGPFAYTGGTCAPLPRRLYPKFSCTLKYSFTPPVTGLTEQILEVVTLQDSNSFGLYGEGTEQSIFADGFD
ncbi:MAG: choice-of-anchor D domain-containing protein [Tahibacter sp.]